MHNEEVPAAPRRAARCSGMPVYVMSCIMSMSCNNADAAATYGEANQDVYMPASLRRPRAAHHVLTAVFSYTVRCISSRMRMPSLAICFVLPGVRKTNAVWRFDTAMQRGQA